jgi:hypothetical protein
MNPMMSVSYVGAKLPIGEEDIPDDGSMSGGAGLYRTTLSLGIMDG